MVNWVFFQLFQAYNSEKIKIYALLVLCDGKPPVTCGLSAQRDSNAERFRYHDIITSGIMV